MIRGAILALEDGTIFRGRSVGAAGSTRGEVVFNTAMTGYQEILTDPSYARQIITFTCPHIGNTGVNAADMESTSVMAAGLVIRDLPLLASSWRAEESLGSFLELHGVVAIADVDTRQLTRLLREKGAQKGCIVAEGDPEADVALREAHAFPGLEGVDLAREVSTEEVYEWSLGTAPPGSAERGPSGFRVVAYDFGVKRSILRLLVDHGCRVTVVPAMTPPEDVLSMAPDGVFLSNGPGDPEPCDYAIRAVRTFLERRVPLFGICLGHQILGLASGARTRKMKFGHHGANHPVQDPASGQVMISSQNHGFVVDEASLPGNLRATHRSLFDGSLQGFERTDRPAFGFQGHPEASPGPHDALPLFERFTKMMADAHG